VTPQSYMQAVAELARVAGDCAFDFFGDDLTVEAKSDGSPVTVADRSAERLARSWIEERFPDDGIVGEEFGAEGANAKRRWIIDPIDGTKSFVRGVPLWGTLVAVADAESIIAGAAFFPALGELIVAAPGEGCWWNDKMCVVSAVADLSKATVLTTDARFVNDDKRRERWDDLSRRAALSRSWGDCYGYLLVATGRAEVMVDPIVSEWDTALFLPIITEAGGVFTDWSGTVTPYGGSAIATNSALADETRRILGAIRGDPKDD
jgi:histidinol-phosphatase